MTLQNHHGVGNHPTELAAIESKLIRVQNTQRTFWSTRTDSISTQWTVRLYPGQVEDAEARVLRSIVKQTSPSYPGRYWSGLSTDRIKTSPRRHCFPRSFNKNQSIERETRQFLRSVAFTPSALQYSFLMNNEHDIPGVAGSYFSCGLGWGGIMSLLVQIPQQKGRKLVEF